ncbi:MAG: response regulator [Candidatus Cloacimonetes bacterium]|nr:response regulator [Candidatus Cloacimonadota bacterium]
MVNTELNIMIIDDDILSLETLHRALELHGYRSTKFADPRIAIKEFAKDRFHIVLTDYKMPGLNGIELARLMKKIDPQVKIIIFTGYYDKEKHEQSIKLGVHNFLCKPLDIEKLIENLRTIEINHKNSIPNKRTTEKNISENK